MSERTSNFEDLVWGRSGRSFELAIEARIPEERRKLRGFDTNRYQLAIGYPEDREELEILAERVLVASEVSPQTDEHVSTPRRRDAEKTGELSATSAPSASRR